MKKIALMSLMTFFIVACGDKTLHENQAESNSTTLNENDTIIQYRTSLDSKYNDVLSSSLDVWDLKPDFTGTTAIMPETRPLKLPNFSDLKKDLYRCNVLRKDLIEMIDRLTDSTFRKAVLESRIGDQSNGLNVRVGEIPGFNEDLIVEMAFPKNENIDYADYINRLKKTYSNPTKACLGYEFRDDIELESIINILDNLSAHERYPWFKNKGDCEKYIKALNKDYSNLVSLLDTRHEFKLISNNRFCSTN